MAQRRSTNGSNSRYWPLINSITVRGFKSIAREQRIEIRPLTILAGANSSGKSSILQPPLLVKQTLESQYDPGALLISGPNVKMTESEQLLWGTGTKRLASDFEVTFESSEAWRLGLRFDVSNEGLDVSEMVSVERGRPRVLRRGMSQKQLRAMDPGEYEGGHRLTVVRDRCFLRPTYHTGGVGALGTDLAVAMVRDFVRNLIHVPGLRPRSAERVFPRAAVGESFPGTFDDYFASVLLHWKRRGDEQLESVGRALESLGLTWKVEARELDATSIEVRVGRLPHSRPGGAHDLVNIADVGFGVSQVLPVIVALWAAKKGDTVFVEQPEVHLHPRAQVGMAGILADAAKRGVRVIVETHSSLLLRGIQTLVAHCSLSPEKVKLHWFQRDDRSGATKIASADLGKDGSFGDWPEDFDDVAIETARQYLDAADARSR